MADWIAKIASDKRNSVVGTQFDKTTTRHEDCEVLSPPSVHFDDIILLYITLFWPQPLSCSPFCLHYITLEILAADQFCDTLHYRYIRNCFQNLKCNNFWSTGSECENIVCILFRVSLSCTTGVCDSWRLPAPEIEEDWRKRVGSFWNLPLAWHRVRYVQILRFDLKGGGKPCTAHWEVQHWKLGGWRCPTHGLLFTVDLASRGAKP